MIIQAGRARAIVNAHSTGEVALTVELDGSGITLIGSPTRARDIAAALQAAAYQAANTPTFPKEK